MCGIAGIYCRSDVSSEKLDDAIDSLLKDIESRGKHATGMLAAHDNGALDILKAAVPASEFIKRRRESPEARVTLLHTRFATQGHQGWMENNHPVRSGRIFLTHNGILENDDDLMDVSGQTRIGETDSEAIAAILAQVGLDDLDEVAAALSLVEGSMAIAALDSKRTDRVLLARGDHSPLYAHVGASFVVWASTQFAVQKAVKILTGREPTYNEVHGFSAGEVWAVTKAGIDLRYFRSPVRKVKPWSTQQSQSRPAPAPTPVVYGTKPKAEEKSEVKPVTYPKPTLTIEPGPPVEAPAIEVVDELECDACNNPLAWEDMRTLTSGRFVELLCRECFYDATFDHDERAAQDSAFSTDWSR